MQESPQGPTPSANGDRDPNGVIEFIGITKYFDQDELPVLDGISFQIGFGEMVALIGPSGCGKSTLLNVLAGLEKPTEGEVRINDPEMRIGYVFQRPRLLPWRTVTRNVEFGVEQIGGLEREEIRARAQAAIQLVNLAGHEGKYPHQLSGGMQQRVAVARGLAIEPHALLLDEPFGSLDALTRSYLQDELAALVQRTRSTALLVTHDIDEALLLADRIIVMSSRPGRVRAEINVPFSDQVRAVDSLIAQPEYPALRSQLRRLLRPEHDDTSEAANAGP
jgi:NitT/TauT family transport system ATP-binding protein